MWFEYGIVLWEFKIFRWLLVTRMVMFIMWKVIVNFIYICNNYCSFCVVGNWFHENGDYVFYWKTFEDY